MQEEHGKEQLKLDSEFMKDIEWWHKYLHMFNGVSIMWMQQVKQPDKITASDACLQGLGATCGKDYLKLKFPMEWAGRNIAYLELLAVIVMVKVWIDRFRGKSVLFKCDNYAVVQVLNSGRSRDSTLLKLMRELVFFCSNKFRV